jgi:hypothetical protein
MRKEPAEVKQPLAFACQRRSGDSEFWRRHALTVAAAGED